MNVFLSYASEERPLAERVCRVLETERHDVFFDRDDLGGGDAFGVRIRDAIARADVLVFLISRTSIASPSYALTELAVVMDLGVRRRPAIVPVRTDATPIDAVPAALRSYTILEPLGDLPADVAHAIDRLQRARRRRRLVLGGGVAAVVALVALVAGVFLAYGSLAPRSSTAAAPPAGENGVAAAVSPAAPAATPLAPAPATGATGVAAPPVIEPRPAPAAPPPAAASATASVPADPIEALNAAILSRVPPDRLVTITGMPGNDGWSAVLVLADRTVSEIQYGIDGGAFRSSGTTDFANPLTGQPQPNTTLRMPGGFWDRHVVAVKYTDVKGREFGPVTVAFEPRAQFLRFAKQALDTVNWVEIQDRGQGERLAYFTPLVSFRAALREIRYSVDSAAVDRTFPLTTDASTGWPGRVDDQVIFVPVPASTRFLTVRVTYADGSMDTRRVDAPR